MDFQEICDLEVQELQQTAAKDRTFQKQSEDFEELEELEDSQSFAQRKQNVSLNCELTESLSDSACKPICQKMEELQSQGLTPQEPNQNSKNLIKKSLSPDRILRDSIGVKSGHQW